MITSAVLHSVSYAGLWGQPVLSLEDTIAKAAELGFDGIEIMAKRPHLSVLDYGPTELKRLRGVLERHHIHAACIAGYTNFTADLEHSDIPQQELQVRHVTDLAQMAQALGCRLVRVFTGYEHPGAPYPELRRRVTECLRECAQRAAAHGVTIGVQNHHDLCCGYESMYDLIAAIDEPNCRAMYDAWAPALQGADIVAAARRMAPLTVYTTIADYQLRPRYAYTPALVNFRALEPVVQAVRMGAGFIDYAAYLRTLVDCGFEGAVAYEMCSPLLEGSSMGVLDSHARTFLEFLKPLRSNA